MRALIILLVLAATVTQAQELTSKFTLVGVDLDGVYNTFKKGDSYAVTAPEGYPTSTIWMTARPGVRQTELQEYVIRVLPVGMSKPEVGDIQTYDSGYVRQYNYKFPVSMQVMNKSGVVLKTFIVVQDNVEFSQLVDSNFLAGSGCLSWSFQPFTHDTTCTTWTAANEDKIKKRLSEMAWCNASERIRWILDAAYGCTQFRNNGYNIYLIKSPTAEQKDIQELCKRMQKTLSNWLPMVTQLSSEKQAKLAKMVDEFAAVLQRPNMTDSLRFLCYYNASVCALLSGRGEKTVEYYNAYIKIRKDAGVPVRLAYNPDGNAWLRYYYRMPMLHADKDVIDISYLGY